jgi:hypothetical protein
MTWGYNEETGEFGIFSVWVWDRWIEAETTYEGQDVSTFTGMRIGVPVDQDVTFFRGVPTQINSLDYADPFGPTTANLSFPGITGFDRLGKPGGIEWLKRFTNVDVYFLPCTVDSWTTWHGHPEEQVINPLTNEYGLYVHEYDPSDVRIPAIWEGFINNVDPTSQGTNVVCQGALYQLDHHYSKPLNPLRPKRTEELIARYFDPRRRGLWTRPLIVDWDRVDRFYTQWDHDRLFAQGGVRFTPTAAYDPMAGSVPLGGDSSEMQLGKKWTTWLTRSTGMWEKALTGYVQPLLATMYARPNPVGDEPSYGTDLTNGDQWTITCDPGRQPRMYLRRQSDPPDMVASYGAPGVSVSLTEEGSLVSNVFYGQGTGPDGVAWNELRVLGDASFITWQPIYPPEGADSLYVGWERNNDLQENYDGYAAYRDRSEGNHIVERYISDFPSGVDEEDAKHITEMWAKRDAEPGWSGTITLEVDVKEPHGYYVISRWNIKPGDVIVLDGWLGGTPGEVVQGENKFFISQVTKSPMSGTVTLTVDTKYRDLLTIEHAQASGKDTLSVVHSLRTGQMSNNIQDLAAPWSANKGAGVMPTSSHDRWVREESFPYTDFTTTFGNRPRDVFKPEFYFKGEGFSTDPNWWTNEPSLRVIGQIENPKKGDHLDKVLSLENAITGPLDTHGLYIPIQAGAVDKNRRWAFFPVLLANAGSIMRSEFACYDIYGHLAPVEFSVTLYPLKVRHTDMPANPNDSTGWPTNPPKGSRKVSALWDGAFEKVRRSGLPWSDPDWHWGNDSQQVGWGTYDRPCGYSPGTKDLNDVAPTGMMVDGSTWDFNMSANSEWQNRDNLAPGETGYQNVVATSISYWAAVYVQIPGYEEIGDPDNTVGPNGLNWVYLRGRFFRSVSIGSGS